MTPERLAAMRALADASVSSERGRWRINASAGRVDVSSFVDGHHDETIVEDVGSRVRASMLAFDGHDLLELLDDHARLTREVASWRLRASPRAQDVIDAGVTNAKFHAWTANRGVQYATDGDDDPDWAEVLAGHIRSMATSSRPAFEILDEMASENAP